MKKILLIVFCALGIFISGCSSSNRLSAEELFNKQKECANYSQEIKSDLVSNQELIEIFYSPIDNTCYYIKQWPSLYYLVDILTKEETMFRNNETEKMAKTIKALKGE